MGQPTRQIQRLCEFEFGRIRAIDGGLPHFGSAQGAQTEKCQPWGRRSTVVRRNFIFCRNDSGMFGGIEYDFIYKDESGSSLDEL